MGMLALLAEDKAQKLGEAARKSAADDREDSIATGSTLMEGVLLLDCMAMVSI